MSHRPATIRILLVDDHILMRMGLVTATNGEPDMEVVGEVENGSEALEACRRHEPDVIVLDLRMPKKNGFETIRELREAGGSGFHCERHAFAQGRYEALTGAPAPVVEGWGREERFERLADALGVSTDEAKAIDQDARQQVAQELGHGRTEVTNAYLG